jgi:hypothetical protein
MYDPSVRPTFAKKDTDRRKGTMIEAHLSGTHLYDEPLRLPITVHAMLYALVSGHRGTAQPSPYHLELYV